MEIKARCKFDKESIKALTHLSSYKKFNPEKTVITRAVLCLVLMLLLVAELIEFDFNIIPIILIIVLILIIVIDCFMYFVLPVIQYKSLAKTKESVNEYIFCDKSFNIKTQSEEHIGETKIEYSMIWKAYETSRYFFVYLTKNQVFIIDKSTVEGGAAEDIRNKLVEFLNDKYITCKY